MTAKSELVIACGTEDACLECPINQLGGGHPVRNDCRNVAQLLIDLEGVDAAGQRLVDESTDPIRIMRHFSVDEENFTPDMAQAVHDAVLLIHTGVCYEESREDQVI
jgi:hypothetical protein